MRVWHSASCNKNVRTLDARLRAIARRSNGNPLAVAFQTDAACIKTKRYTLSDEHVTNRIRHIRVFTPDQALTGLNHGHLAAEATVHLRKLKANVTTSDHNQMLRHMLDMHDAFIIQKGDVGNPRHVWHHGAAANIDEDARRLKLALAYTDAVRPGELCVPD